MDIFSSENLACFHQSRNGKRKYNPTHYREPRFYSKICWMWQEVASHNDRGFQQFLDNVHYKSNRILRYERVFGPGFVSTGGLGLLRTLHPHWSPAVIKSTVMTTSATEDDNNEDMSDSWSHLKATPFAYGARHMQPNKAIDPEIIYNLTTLDYLNFLCVRGYNETTLKSFSDSPFKCPKSFTLADFNYLAIVVPNLQRYI